MTNLIINDSKLWAIEGRKYEDWWPPSFQAICRTNRLNGEDKDYGYIVDFKEFFGDVQ